MGYEKSLDIYEVVYAILTFKHVCQQHI